MIARFLVILPLCLSIVKSADADTLVARLYNEGNARYKEGDYARAVKAYERALASGVRNGKIYYNLGNAYFKLNQLGRAILAYERAQRMMTDDEDVASNLQFANLLKVDKPSEGEVNAITRFGQRLFNSISPDGISVLFGACLFGLAAALIGRMFLPDRGNRAFWIGLLVFFGGLFFLCGTTLAFKIHSREFEQAAIVMVSEADGRSGPGDQYLKVFTLHEGTKVIIERSEGVWHLVRLPSGLGGWIIAGGVEGIKVEGIKVEGIKDEGSPSTPPRRNTVSRSQSPGEEKPLSSGF